MRRSVYILMGVILLFTSVMPAAGEVKGSTSIALAETAQQAEGVSTGMPGWPMPEKPIPHHEPGHLSKASSYTTLVDLVNAEGINEVVQVNGLNAITADGGDPFSGNYTVVSNDQLMRSTWSGSMVSMNTMVVTPTISEIPGSQRSIGNYPASDIAQGDLNGDGQFEQITAWMGSQNYLHLSAGEIPGTPAKTTSAPAAVAEATTPGGYSLGFDGSDDYVNVGNGINLVNSSFTVAFWAKRSSISTDDYVLYQGTGSPNLGLHVGFRSSDQFTCAFWANDLNTIAYTDLDWHYWACTYNADTNLRSIYRDGLLVAQDTASADYQGTGDMIIGGLTNFGGLIDEVGIWNSERSQAAVQADAVRNVPDTVGMLGYWNFNEGSGTTAADSSGNGNNGVLVNHTQWSVETAPQEDIHLLTRGYDDSLWHCGFDIETARCLIWDNSGGGTWLSAPAAVSLGADQFDVFAIGTDNQVYGRHWNSGWTGDWQQQGTWPFAPSEWKIPLPELPAPVAIARGSTIELFRFGPDNTLYWFAGAIWLNLGGMLASGPGAVSLSESHMQVFARGLDDALWTISYNGTWGNWQHLELDGMTDASIASAPSVIKTGTGQFMVYVRGSDNQSWYATSTGGSWEKWNSAGGELASNPTAAASSGGTYQFAQNSDALLQYNAGGDTWVNLGGLNGCCTLQVTDIVPTRWNLGNFDDFTLDIDSGYFWGDGRSQTVVAYYSAANEVSLGLYDISDNPQDPGFTFELITNPVLTLPHNVDWFRLTTGDFLYADGQDDVAIAYIQGGYAGVDILEFDRDTRTFSTAAQTIYEIGSFQGSIELTAGDYDADGQDELAATTISYYGDWEHMPACDTWHFVSRMRVYDVNIEGNGILALRSYYTEGDRNLELKTGTLQSVRLSLASGDFNGDGKDEIVRTWQDHYDESNYYCGGWWYDIENIHKFNRALQVVSLPYNANPFNNTWAESLCTNPYGCLISGGVITNITTVGSTWNSYGDRLAAGDFDRDMRSEFVWQVADNSPAQTLYAYKFNPSTSQFVQYASLWQSWGYYARLVTGAFTGDSVLVGEPSYRTQLGMTTPEVFLNLPPMHRDIISGVGEIVIDNGAQAIYSAGNTDTRSSTSASNRDWSLSTGMEMSVGGMGSTVKTSLNNTYGEKFGKTETGINTYSYADTTTAQYYDQLIYNGTNYGVWEYPVYNVETSGTEGPATIMVVFPLVDTTTQPNTAQGRVCDENFYTPSHQPYNVWSYDRIGSILFQDYDAEGLIESKQTQGGDNISVGMSVVDESQRTNSFSNQVSAGLEYSYENELNIPLIGKAWDFSFRASVNSSFNIEEISTLSSSYLTETKVTIDFPGIADPSAYDIVAYFYWAKAGYLVVDYQTQPALMGSWLLYNKTDPAFILPWYGFPDPDTGQFPSLPDMDAPPCGRDKQLFTHDIEVNPAYAENLETVTLTATVRNFSNITPIKDVMVNFYLGAPAGGNQIATCTIPKAQLARVRGPAACAATWQVQGASGEEKIYAVIDPGDQLIEMHDEDDFIDNNVGYGLLYVANADYFDPGLNLVQYYQSVLYTADPGLDYGLYIPTSNSIDTVRYELVPRDLGDVRGVGVPIEVMAFLGGEQEKDEEHTFAPIPGGLLIGYSDDDLLPGMIKANLKLYHLESGDWVEYSCPGYELIRFDDVNIIAAPICQTGIFMLSDTLPALPLQQVFLPVINK